MNTPGSDSPGKVLVLGASSGIGRSAALALADAGAELVVVGRRAHLLDEFAADRPSVTALAADLADAGECARVADEAVKALGGGIDAVLHAVGTSPLAKINETPADAWHEVFATNVIGPNLVTAGVLPALTPGGLVAFMSSRSVHKPYHGVGAYSAAKAALDRSILNWRLEQPNYRFLRIEVGDTTGTDFSRSFDATLIRELFPLWVTHGTLSANTMDCVQVGAAVAEAVWSSLSRPGIAVNELVLHPPGGPRTQGIAELLAPLDARE